MNKEDKVTVKKRISCSVLIGFIGLLAACTQEPTAEETRLPDVRPGMIATNAFYYYADVDAAWVFYRDVLGLETVVDYGFAKILRLAESSYLTVVDAAEGMHSADEAKIVTLHLVSDELVNWHTHFLRFGVPIDYGGASAEGGMPNSFVVRDPGGYALRFLRYNPHPDHGAYVEAFAHPTPVVSSAGGELRMSIRATAFSLYYNDAGAIRPFFEGLFDLDPIGELDGSPLYQLAESGFVSLEEVDGPPLESPGENGMTLSVFTHEVDAWFERASRWPGLALRTPEVLEESGLVRVFVGYDPAGVFLEWDTFLDLPENRTLMDYLRRADVY